MEMKQERTNNEWVAQVSKARPGPHTQSLEVQLIFDRGNHGPSALGPPKVMKNGSCSATTVAGSTALPFVISTGAQRSGEICGSAVLSWECFSTERIRISYFAMLAATTYAVFLKRTA